MQPRGLWIILVLQGLDHETLQQLQIVLLEDDLKKSRTQLMVAPFRSSINPSRVARARA